MEEDEAAHQVWDAYARREQLGLDTRYAYWEPANLFIYQSRERALVDLLARARMLPLGDRKILDVGCGDGSILRDLQRLGANPARCTGVDLIPLRVTQASRVFREGSLAIADGQRLPFSDDSFDMVTGFTTLSSLKSAGAATRVAGEMRRVTKPGGKILIYDFWTNPLNRDVLPLRRSRLRQLFAGLAIDFQSTTLAPPLARRLIGIPGGRLACDLLEMVPLLKTHYVALIRR